MAGFDELVTEALTAPFSGWDFSWPDRRSWTEPLPWDYTARVAALARRARTMLDMGTGGGEALSGLPDRAPRTIATEAWPPNVTLGSSSIGDAYKHGERASAIATAGISLERIGVRFPSSSSLSSPYWAAGRGEESPRGTQHRL